MLQAVYNVLYECCISAMVQAAHNALYECYICAMVQGAYNRPDIFETIPSLCAKTHSIIVVVFSAPETVMAKFVLNIFNGKLQVKPIILSLFEKCVIQQML